MIGPFVSLSSYCLTFSQCVSVVFIIKNAISSQDPTRPLQALGKQLSPSTRPPSPALNPRSAVLHPATRCPADCVSGSQLLASLPGLHLKKPLLFRAVPTALCGDKPSAQFLCCQPSLPLSIPMPPSPTWPPCPLACLPVCKIRSSFESLSCRETSKASIA